jgi:hypothetical protein
MTRKILSHQYYLPEINLVKETRRIADRGAIFPIL